MSNLDPSGPSQPSQQTGLNQSQNPADKTSEETSTSKDTTSTEEGTIDHRSHHDVPSTHSDEATASSLGQGDSGPLKQKDISESDKMNYSEDGNLEGEQMRAPGEGEIADAVKKGGGGGHKGEASLTENLDAKTQEHNDELHARGERTGAEIEEEEKEDWTGKKADVDVGEALGGRGTKVVLAAEE